MIIDKTGSKATRRTQTIYDAPRTYKNSPATPRSNALHSFRELPSNIEPTSSVQIIRKEGSVKGTWILDPAHVIASTPLSPLTNGAAQSERKSVHLQSKGGSISGDIYIKPTSCEALLTMKTQAKISIYAMSKEGKVEIKIHDGSPLLYSDKRLPISIEARAQEGDVRIYLPRSFCGPFHITTKSSSKNSLVLSEGVRGQLSTFSDNMNAKQGFIGRLDGESDMHGAVNMADWGGDILEAEIMESSSHVKLYFDDEEEKRAHNFFSFKKLFSPL